MTSPHPRYGSPIAFAIVDVFATGPLTGNALAVVPDADALDVPTMRALAREFNQSETTFLCTPTVPAADWRLRSFTAAGHEVGGAGHNALGAWLWLAHAGRVGPGTFAQQIGADVLAVEVGAGEPVRVTMRQSAPRFGAVLGDRAELAAALGLGPDELVPSRPAQVVSTGAGHLLVPVVSRSVVDRVDVDSARLAEVLRSVGGEGCYVYTTAPGEPADGAHAYARFFNPTMGIVEDPGTGTAAGPLAATLVRNGDVPAGDPVLVRQGDATGRPSRLRIDVAGEQVRISATGLVVATGRLTL
jgi:PhzF family phenazine biosynthesis protein